MKDLELRIAAPVWNALNAYHLAPGKHVEALSYLFAEIDESSDAIRILVPHTAPLVRFDADCFERQTPGHVRLHSDVERGLLIGFARSHYRCLINIHDHWFDAYPAFSPVDDADDRAFDHYLRDRFEPNLAGIAGAIARPVANVALVLGREGAAARLIDTRHDDPFRRIDRITIVGDRWRTVALGREPVKPGAADARHSRHGDFIAAEHQAALEGLHAVLVGCGGTGSILAETLGRIGIGALTLIDEDRLEETNLNRWQGGEPGMVGKPKAVLLARRLNRMFPRLRTHALRRSVFDPVAEAALYAADVLFGAVDADAPRLFLNRVALQLLVPYFDVGVAVTRAEDGAIDFRKRAFAVYPGISGCIECTRFTLFDRQQTEAVFLDPATASEWSKAGYVEGDPQALTPSVYALNQGAVGLVVTEFLNWLCAWRPAATVVSESWRRGTCERADRANFPERPDPDCPVCSYLAGAGSSERLPRPPAFSAQRQIRSRFKESKQC
jgi:ThiF family